jgi:hypothetical protein
VAFRVDLRLQSPIIISFRSRSCEQTTEQSRRLECNRNSRGENSGQNGEKSGLRGEKSGENGEKIAWIPTTPQPPPSSITLVTRSRTACYFRQTDTHMQLCTARCSGTKLGAAISTNNAGAYNNMKMSTTQFGVRSSSILNCAGNSNGITVSCPMTRFCTFRGIGRDCCPQAINN